MPFDPATVRLLSELLRDTNAQHKRDLTQRTKLPTNSKSKMAQRLDSRIGEAVRVARDLDRLLGGQEANPPQLGRRAQWLADGRALLDFIEANPDLPQNQYSGIEVRYHALLDDDDDEAMAAVDAIAKQLGTPVTTPDMPGSHYETEIRFGSASYRAIAVLKAWRERRAAIDRLGEAALAEQAEQDRTANGGEPR